VQVTASNSFLSMHGAHAWLMSGNLFVRYRMTAKAN